MWSSDRRTALVLLAGALAGCGFTPVYGPGGAAEGLRGTIDIDPPRDPMGFALVRRLEERLGLPKTTDYVLSVRIYTGQERLGVTSGQVTTRYNINGRATFTLRAAQTNRIVTRGSVESFTSYAATGTPFATQVARDDARERLMQVLADQIVSRLLATADSWVK